MPAASTSRRHRPRPRTRLLVDDRRAQLIALGIQIFGERPYDDVSIEDLARAARISKGLLYHYFPTKRDFYVAAIGQATKDLLAKTSTARSLAPGERLERGLSAYLSYVEEHERAYVAIVRGGIGADEEVMTILERTRRSIVRRILEAVEKRAVTPLVRTSLRGWVGFVEAASVEWLTRRDVPRETLVSVFITMLLSTFSAAGAQPIAGEGHRLEGGPRRR